MVRPFLVIFVGVPGSGKTTFSKNLVKKLNAVILNSDAIRRSMWGSLENIQATHADMKARKYNNQLTFGAMNYAASQILQIGMSVIYDCNANGRLERQEKHEIAAKNQAISIVIRIKVPYEVSLERLQSREDTVDSRKKTLKKAVAILERFMREIEEPTPDEFTIEIDGEQSFEEQYEVFNKALEGHLSR